MLIQTLAGQQSSQASRQNIGIKDETLDRLINLLQQMNRAANALAEEIDGIEDLFRMPRRRSEAVWLATARTFLTDSAPFEAQLQELISVENFRTELGNLINAVEQAASSADIAAEQKGGATGGLVAAFKDAGKTSRRLNAIVRNKYDGNAQKIAAWEIASHLEAAPKRPVVGWLVGWLVGFGGCGIKGDMSIKRFEDIQAWQSGQELAVLVYEYFRNLKDFSFKDQICRAAVSVSNNIAEGFDRHSNKEFLHFLFIARGSNNEVKSMIYLAQRLDYITQNQFNEAINKCNETGKKTNAFISYLLKSTN